MTTQQAQTVLLRATGRAHADIGRIVGACVPSVAKWLKAHGDNVEGALLVVERDARVQMALTLQSWAKALSEADTSKLLARDLRDLQTAIDKGPTAPGITKSPKRPEKPANKGNSPKLFKV